VPAARHVITGTVPARTAAERTPSHPTEHDLVGSHHDGTKHNGTGHDNAEPAAGDAAQSTRRFVRHH